MGVVYGGVYCVMIESIVSMVVFVWFNLYGEGGSVVGVNNNMDFVCFISLGMVYGIVELLYWGWW